MSKAGRKRFDYQVLELDGVRYAVVRERRLQGLCRRAGVEAGVAPEGQPAEAEAYDGRKLARRLLDRRKRAGITQAELARRADIRVETLNRLERGKTNPDFATIRKLMNALKQLESKRSLADRQAQLI